MQQIILAIENFFLNHLLLAFILRLSVATLCGAAIGLERTKRSKEAGIRTHCIIAAASALIMIISKYGFADLFDEAGNALAATRGADPSRVAAQVVSGISFLGAGVIFKNGNAVKGLTTAAGIWATAAVGLAIGGGMYLIGFCVTILILVVQTVMHHFNVGNDAFSTGEIRLTTVDTPEIRSVLREKQKELGITIVSSRITTCADNTLNMVLSVRMKKSIPFSDVMKFMDEHPEIKSLSV